jgi:hypothetical protein
MRTIDPDAPAILIWLGGSIAPSDKDFEGSSQSWTLEQAVEQAYEASKDQSKWPWIMTEGQILDENGIAQVMSGIRAMRRFDSA